ncbi:MAG: hypothetical protein PHT59_07010 [Candidatus Omnitrophica bacterium]|nr:hypothetical protein [Candidatus Omnitrophota bacterium]
MSNTKNMSPEHMEMYLAFVLREKRVLRSRETSFPSEELAAAEKQLRCILREVHSKIKKKEELDLILAKPTKRRQLALDVLRKCKGTNRKHVILVVDNFNLFEEVLKKAINTKIVLPDPTKGDAFYVPKKHNYR